ncbi:MAG TPA: nuclear transport factor 2 family protein [Chthoniobacterales bacterium]|nr:nuclear transport factor 2 family protein [Chthoniobacterales bacterium]
MSNELAQLAADRYEIGDALHRFAFGLDHGDADSLGSALTEDCILDFRPAGKKLGLDFPKLSGRQTIVDTLVPLLGPLDTSHTVSNVQIEVSEDSATLYCYVMAQHFMPREGPRPGSENAILMNRYDCELVRDGQKWRFRRMIIDSAWAQGNPEILNALATQRVLAAKSRPAKP